MIYLDYAATTPLAPQVFERMLPYFTQNFGNANSQYQLGRMSANAVITARDQIAQLVGCKGEEIYFTSGGTEADNLAIKGYCLANQHKGKHLVVSAIEHPAVIESANDLKKMGFEVTFVNPNAEGILQVGDLQSACREDTILLAVMSANNETGALQPVEEIGKLCKERGIFYFCDCVQSAPTMPLPIDYADGISFSAHKMYGPKGVGVLIMKGQHKFMRQMSGGHQERALRGGTTNTPCVVGCGVAFQLACEQRAERIEKMQQLKNHFQERVMAEIEGVHCNTPKNSLAGHCNLSFDGCEGSNLLFLLDMKGVAVSTGSACSAGAVTASHVLLAMGYSQERASSALRFTFGEHTNREEVDQAIDCLKQVIATIRAQQAR